MTSIVGKKQDGKTYYYAVESARVDGKPRIVSQQYLGSAEEVMAKIAGAGPGGAPVRTAHHSFGDVAAVWGVLERLGVAAIIDEVVGGTAPVKGVSVGRFLVLAALNRVVAPCSKARFSEWWATTAGPRFTRIGAAKLDHRRFWDAMNQVTAEHLEAISARVAAKIVTEYAVDTSAVALDMTNFATWVDSTNEAAPILARVRSKQKRSDLRLFGLGLVVTRDGGIPLAFHPYPGNRPDVSVFTRTLDALTAAIDTTGATGATGGTESNDAAVVCKDVTVVFDAGQNSAANFTYLIDTGARYVGSTPPSDHADLLAVPAGKYAPVDGFDGLSAYEDTKTVYGQPHRVVLTHSKTLHAGQSRGFDQTLAKATAGLDELAATLARGKTRRSKEAVNTEIARITHNTWVKEVLTVTVAGENPKDVSPTRPREGPGRRWSGACSANAS
ncbi:IS1634 family transposase [Arthrobacter sp. H5]|uniref:IS1634 family transposase n=2 Tax=Arthrobacter sp. H5 TaxID=1267973 RepID=UPI0004B7ED85|nr:IS1634 family transposase [Arthrobacter sp. H5]